MYMCDILTVPTSIAGLPALSAPAGTNHEGLPIGVQLMGPMKSDANLLALAKSMEILFPEFSENVKEDK
jgi:aspartyl-tRNA(Asn)/glutamyl-tRNA(Gln) amidotransferase subunit A